MPAAIAPCARTAVRRGAPAGTPAATPTSAGRSASTATTTTRTSSGTTTPASCGAARQSPCGAASRPSVRSTARACGSRSGRSPSTRPAASSLRPGRLIRLDALLEDPADPAGPLELVPPPACIATEDLAALVRTTAAGVELATAAHPDAPLASEGAGWLLRWGRQVDVRVTRDAATAGRLSDGTPVQDLDVASYLAKYATKATEAVGLLAHRLTPATVGRYADPSTHVGRLIAAAWRLGRPEALAPLDDNGRAPYDRLRKWTHMLGFGGHFLTKSRAYSTTFAERRASARAGAGRPASGSSASCAPTWPASSTTSRTTTTTRPCSSSASGRSPATAGSARATARSPTPRPPRPASTATSSARSCAAPDQMPTEERRPTDDHARPQAAALRRGGRRAARREPIDALRPPAHPGDRTPCASAGADGSTSTPFAPTSAAPGGDRRPGVRAQKAG